MREDQREAFAAWLADEQGLARTSVRKAVTDLATLRARGPAPEAELQRRRVGDYRWAWALYADWCDAEGLDNDLPEPVLPDPDVAGAGRGVGECDDVVGAEAAGLGHCIS